MAAVYRDARLKIDRAEKHLADLSAGIAALEEIETSTIDHDQDAGVQFLKHTPPDIEKELLNLSLIVGDAIHNMHAALDYAWASTIERLIPAAFDDHTKFPVRGTREELEAALKGRKIDTLRPDLFDLMVVKIQPYRGHNSAILVLHELDISDKHLLLLELIPTHRIRGISIRDAEGQVYDGISIPVPNTGPYTLRFAPGVTIEDQGKFSVTVVIKDAGWFKGVPILDLLSSFRNYTFYTVQLLENL